MLRDDVAHIDLLAFHGPQKYKSVHFRWLARVWQAIASHISNPLENNCTLWNILTSCMHLFKKVYNLNLIPFFLNLEDNYLSKLYYETLITENLYNINTDFFRFLHFFA